MCACRREDGKVSEDEREVYRRRKSEMGVRGDCSLVKKTKEGVSEGEIIEKDCKEEMKNNSKF